jgi:hypothetical protein
VRIFPVPEHEIGRGVCPIAPAVPPSAAARPRRLLLAGSFSA